jgi:hypothetical protein
LWGEFVIFFAVPPRVFSCRFRLGTGLITDARTASTGENGEKLTGLIDGWSLVYNKARWFTGAASVSPEARRKSCGLKMFLSHGKTPVATRCSLACCYSLVCIAELFANLVEGDASSYFLTDLFFNFFWQ